jgi:hypothetical protein
MAIDESCYVTVESETEVKVLSADFLRFSEEFIRNVQEALRLPHCELRESVEYQRIERLKLNSHSIRFLAQRGERIPLVPGRAAVSASRHPGEQVSSRDAKCSSANVAAAKHSTKRAQFAI